MTYTYTYSIMYSMIYTPTSLRKDLFKVLKEGNTVEILYEGKLWRLEVYEATYAQAKAATSPRFNSALINDVPSMTSWNAPSEVDKLRNEPTIIPLDD